MFSFTFGDRNVKANPCKDCSNRKVGCHANCEGYIKFRKNYEELRERMNKHKRTEVDYSLTRRPSHAMKGQF